MEWNPGISDRSGYLEFQIVAVIQDGLAGQLRKGFPRFLTGLNEFLKPLKQGVGSRGPDFNPIFFG